MSSPAESGSSATSQQPKQHDRKSVSGSVETPLSLIKVTPLSSFFNNKVGSSFQEQRRGLINYGQGLQASLVLPVVSRKVRDSGALLFMLAFLGFLGYIIWDGMFVKEADINLIVHGHDSYGNICGRNNRPIRFVEKSGRNYTNKPITKYTLINSKFERYTLDSSRLKNGELFYVKQQYNGQFGDQEELVSRSNDDRRRQLTVESRMSSAGVRIKRSGVEPLMEQDLMRRNRTLLNSLKSKLMYQYPPMYGYNPATTVQTITAPMAMSDNERQRPRANRHRDAGASEAIAGASAGGNRAAVSSAGSGNSDAIQSASLESAASQTETSFRRPEVTSQRPLRSSTLTVIHFDDQANDNERYDHMFVTPTANYGGFYNHSPKSRSPDDGFSQNEVSNQLLYLTECVDYCPEDHVELIFYRCMPKNWRFSLFPNAINVTRTFIDDIITDVTHCYRELIYIFSLALVLSLALLILLRFLASLIIWTCIAILVTLFISMASYSWMNYYQQIVDLNNLMPHDSTYAERLNASDKWLVGSIFLTFLAFATIGTVIFMRKRILLVTTLFRESGKAIADMPLLLLQPLLTFVALVTITAAWSVGLMCLQSMKLPVIDMSTGFVVFKAEVLYKVMKWYHIFAFLWVSHFAIACQHYVIGASVTKWYFSSNRYNLNSPIGTSIAELILYYLGSVALGSFLVAIFKVVRIILKQIQYLVQKNCMAHAGGPNNNGADQMSPANISHSCCGSFTYVWRLFIWFFDNIVMIINRDAYVEIAIYGHSFIGGARRAFHVLATNPLRLLAIKSVSNILLIVAKICVVFGTVSVAIILLEEKTTTLNYSWSPVVISAIYAYVVAHWFLSVYEMVIDALFICYCEDYERSKNQEITNQVTSSNFMSQILNNTRMD